MERILAMGAALIIDRFLGDPAWIPHPVVGFGRLIAYLEARLYRSADGPARQIFSGAALLVILAATAVLPTSLLMGLSRGWPRFGLMTVLFWLALSMETMKREARMVADKLQGDTLAQARRQVGRIVGRDTARLSALGVTKACVESVAESTSDGIIAPLFWGILLGPAGAMLYKAVNTLDSMVGYKNERYLYFGRASALADDLLNVIPARLTGILASLLAFTVSGSPGDALAVYRRDRANHASPNSGHPEAAFAGALGIELAGPAIYEGHREAKPRINAGARSAVPGDIERSIRLMQAVVVAAWALFLLVGLMMGESL